MVSNFGARTTFYDIIGYLIPGVFALGVLWLYWYVIISSETALLFAKLLSRHVGLTSIGLVTGGYVAGHLVNSLSSLILEKWIFRKAFEDAKNWYDRVSKKSQVRANQIHNNVLEFFGVPVEEISVFDMRIRMEEELPGATITGFSFLSFYGMCRTLMFLVLFAAIPISYWSSRLVSSKSSWLVFALMFMFMFAIAAAFKYQYLRFVVYYYDFMGSTLLYKSNDIDKQ